MKVAGDGLSRRLPLKTIFIIPKLPSGIFLNVIEDPKPCDLVFI